MADPFSTFYEALWAEAIADVELAAMVKLANRIRYDSATDRDPLKENVLAADLPELALVVENTTIELGGTSCTTKVNATYSWLISTGDFRITTYLLPTIWRLMIVNERLTKRAHELTFEGTNYIESISAATATIGYSDPEKNRGILGWSAGLSLQVRFVLPNNLFA